MALCMTAVSQLLVHWRYCSLVKSHGNEVIGSCLQRVQQFMTGYCTSADTGARSKWPTSSRWHFQMHFVECKVYVLIQILQIFLQQGPINNTSALDHVMAWYHQAPSHYLTPVEKDSWHLMVSQGHNEFTELVLMSMTPGYQYRADSRFAPSQWETALLCNDVSNWLGTNLKSALSMHGNNI